MKPHNLKILHSRAERAIQNLYHNATPSWPNFQNDEEFSLFNSWFEEEARFAFDDFDLCFEDAERFKQLFGKMYQWGRSGRTVAPKGVINQRGGSSFNLNEDAMIEWNVEELTEGILLLEKFNWMVEQWNKDVPYRFKEYVDFNIGEVAELSNN